jgi:glycosyltransferase involved in cell wall biosynthesis
MQALQPKPTERASERVRLLEFLTFFYIGGTERQVVNLVGGLNRARFDLHLGCLARRGQFLDEVESHEVPIAEYPTNSLYNLTSWKQRLKLARHLRNNRIDIVHSYGFYGNLFAIPAARLARTPVVIAAIRDTGEMLTRAQRLAQKQICRLADCVLVNADAIRRWLIGQGYAAEKIRVIRNGIVPPGPADRDAATRVRRSLGLAAEVPLIGVLSRLNQMKGIEYFLEAAAAMGRRDRDPRFLIIGDGGHRKELEQYAAQLGLGERVLFTGFRTDVSDVLSALDISVLPSLSEGLSNSLLESMAAGLPVIATNVGGNPEAVEDGVTGIIVPPGDAGALARGMVLLLDNAELAAGFGEAGRRRIAHWFSVQTMVRETEALYLRLLERRRAAPAGRPAKGEA